MISEAWASGGPETHFELGPDIAQNSPPLFKVHDESDDFGGPGLWGRKETTLDLDPM